MPDPNQAPIPVQPEIPGGVRIPPQEEVIAERAGQVESAEYLEANPDNAVRADLGYVAMSKEEIGAERARTGARYAAAAKAELWRDGPVSKYYSREIPPEFRPDTGDETPPTRWSGLGKK